MKISLFTTWADVKNTWKKHASIFAAIISFIALFNITTFANILSPPPSSEKIEGGSYTHWIAESLQNLPPNTLTPLDDSTNILMSSQNIADPQGNTILTSYAGNIGVGISSPQDHFEIFLNNPIVEISATDTAEIILTDDQHQGGLYFSDHTSSTLNISEGLEIYEDHANIADVYEMSFTIGNNVRIPVTANETQQSCRDDELMTGFDEQGNIICQQIHCVIGTTEPHSDLDFSDPNTRERFANHPDQFKIGGINGCIFKTIEGTPSGHFADDSLNHKTNENNNDNDQYFYNFAKFSDN